MPCFGVPVLTAGTGRYSGLGFTLDSETREDYLDKVRQIDRIGKLSSDQVELARRHAFAALRLRPVPFCSFEMTQDKFDSLGHALDHNVVIRATSLDELRRAPDLEAFAHWASRTEDDDMLLASAPDCAARAA
jgi:hypothetical protein